MTEEELNKELEENERLMVQCVCDTIRNGQINVAKYLAEFIASLCLIDRDMMFSRTSEHDAVQARGLFFYAYRYMTGDTYEHIGRISKDVFGTAFTATGVVTRVNSMYELIEQQPIWRKRWTIVKRIIKSQNEMVAEPPIPITIKVPKNVEITIKRE